MTITSHNKASMAQEIYITPPDVSDSKVLALVRDRCSSRIRVVTG